MEDYLISDFKNDEMDKECIDLCNAINRIPGLRTFESCCGHDKRGYKVFFMVDNMKYFSILLYYIVPCHVGFEWFCEAETDCGMSPVTFRLHSGDEIGKEAYKQADIIAEKINQFMDTDFDDFPEER